MPKPTQTAADTDKLPPTSPKVMSVLIVLLLILVFATGKATFYPKPPVLWSSIHEKPNLPIDDVNRILLESHALLGSVKTEEGGASETWQLNHRTGTWSLQVNFKKTPEGLVYDSEQVRCDISNFPSFTRTWDYPEKK